MAEKFLIGDTILFTAGIKNLRTGAEYSPSVITVSVYKKSGECLLDKEPAEKIENEDYNYAYEWTIAGTEGENGVELIDKNDLIVIWDWSGPHKKRLKFMVIPQV